MKICVYAIAKNEEQFVERFCESAADADLILIADTGSTDGTIQKIIAQKATTNNIHFKSILIQPWRFDMARDAALAMIPSNIDVCVSLDLDEVLQPGWREEIERVWKVGETTRLKYLFDWGLGLAFYYEKIHARWGYRWHHPCHEYPMPYGITENWAQTDRLLVVHKPDPTKSRSQYLEMLRWSVEEDPHCPRNSFYYARELMYHGNPVEAIEEAHRHLSLPRATWNNERCYAYRVIGECQVKLGHWGDAEKAYLMAAAEAPNTREPWCALAELYYKLNRFSESYTMAVRCLSIVNKEKVYTMDPEVWGWKPHLYACIGAWNMEMRLLSLEHALKALEFDPDNQLLNNNIAVMRDIMFPKKEVA